MQTELTHMRILSKYLTKMCMSKTYGFVGSAGGFDHFMPEFQINEGRIIFDHINVINLTIN